MVPKLLAVLVAALLALVLVAPLATAQTEMYGSRSGDPRFEEDARDCLETRTHPDATCIVLYGHIFDMWNLVPINIQRPPDGTSDLSRGVTTSGYEPLHDWNQITLRSSPGFVEYRDGEDPRIHPERGLSFAALPDPDAPLYGYWYMSADFTEHTSFGIDEVPGYGDPGTGVLPCVSLRMYLQAGRSPGGGEILSDATITKTIVTSRALAGQETPDLPSHACTNDREATVTAGDVIEFKVPMPPLSAPIPKDRGFIVQVEWWTHAPGSPDRPEKVYPIHWNLHTGDAYANRVVVPIVNPLRVESVRHLFLGGQLYVLAGFNSPWGSHDVDPSSIRMQVFDARGNEVDLKDTLAPPILRYSVDHHGHFKPVNATFAWDHAALGLAPGDHTIRVSAKNWQWSAEVRREVQVRLAEDPAQSVALGANGEPIDVPPPVVETSPAPSVLVLLLAFVAAWGTRRRFGV